MYALSCGERIKEYRENAKIKQYELALRAGITPNYLSLIECGKRRPSPDVLLKIAKVFDVLVDDLLSDESVVRKVRRVTEQVNVDQAILEIARTLPQLIENHCAEVPQAVVEVASLLARLLEDSIGNMRTITPRKPSERTSRSRRPKAESTKESKHPSRQ